MLIVLDQNTEMNVAVGFSFTTALIIKDVKLRQNNAETVLLPPVPRYRAYGLLSFLP